MGDALETESKTPSPARRRAAWEGVEVMATRLGPGGSAELCREIDDPNLRSGIPGFPE